jgi:hypothetical protein
LSTPLCDFLFMSDPIAKARSLTPIDNLDGWPHPVEYTFVERYYAGPDPRNIGNPGINIVPATAATPGAGGMRSSLQYMLVDWGGANLLILRP